MQSKFKEKIDINIKKISKLARIYLTDKEISNFSQDIKNMVSAFSKLQDLTSSYQDIKSLNVSLLIENKNNDHFLRNDLILKSFSVNQIQFSCCDGQCLRLTKNYFLTPNPIKEK